MKRVIASLLVFLFTIFISEGVFAAEIKIAYVNLQKALNESQPGKDAKEDMGGEVKRRQDEVNLRQEELKKLKEEIDKKGAVWSKEIREQKEKEFQAKSQDFQRFFLQSEDELRRKEQEKVREIIKELQEIVRELAKKKGYTYVFEKTEGGVIYGPDEMDLTDEVIKIYNGRYKKEKK